MSKKLKIGLVIFACYALVVSVGAQIDITTPYPSPGQVSGDKIDQARTVVLYEDNLVHVDSSTGSDGYVNKGDAVVLDVDGAATVAGSAGVVGVAFTDAAASTSYVTVETSGIFWLNVNASSSIAYGERVYISNVTGVISDSTTSSTVFGYALNETAITTTTTTIIPIRVDAD